MVRGAGEWQVGELGASWLGKWYWVRGWEVFRDLSCLEIPHPPCGSVQERRSVKRFEKDVIFRYNSFHSRGELGGFLVCSLG